MLLFVLGEHSLVKLRFCCLGWHGWQRIGPLWLKYTTHKSKNSDVIPKIPKTSLLSFNSSAYKSYAKEPPARKMPVIESVVDRSGEISVIGMLLLVDNFAKTIFDLFCDCVFVCS